MPIPQNIIDDINSRLQIEEVVAEYVPTLKKKGNSYLGLCPFHKEKTPSFSVTPDKNMYYCFGCQEGGNIFSFISKIENLTFPESVKFLGKKAGIEVIENNNQNSNKLDFLTKVNEYCAKVYNRFLTSSSGMIGMNYIKERGLSDECINDFLIGFAPDKWDFIKNSIRKHDINENDALKTGLLSLKKETGRYYDRFRGRIIFPIFNKYNKVIAFGGRIVGEGEPKYLNSPESEIFKKRETLYGYNLAKNHIKDCKRAIIVEGYLDVIGLYQEGIQNAVAPLGTALTEEHMKMLSRIAEEVILLFDSDSAGISASIKSIEFEKDVNTTIKVATLPEGDPFDYIKKYGSRKLLTIIDSAMNPVDFKLNSIYKKFSGRALNERLEAVFNLIDTIYNESERAEYLEKISEMELKNQKGIGARQNLKNNIIKDYHNRKNGINTNYRNIKNKYSKTEKFNYIDKSYCDLISLLMNYPVLIQKSAFDFSEKEIKNTIIKKVYVKTIEYFTDNENGTLAILFNKFDENERDFINKCIYKEQKMDDIDIAYNEIYINHKIYMIDEKINFYFKEVEKGQGENSEFLIEIEVLRREKEKLQNYINNVNHSGALK